MWHRTGKTPGGRGGARNKGQVLATTFIGVSTGKGKQSRMNGFGLDALSNFGGFWCVRVVPCCLAPGP